MTVKECFERAMSFIPEKAEENPELMEHAVTWANVLLSDTVNYENIYRRVHSLPEIDSVPTVGSLEDEIPYNSRMVAAAFPYGMARWIFRDNEDVAGSHEYYQLYTVALTEATPLEYCEMEDVYR